MTITKAYAGNLAASFREEDTFLDSLLERESYVRWTPQPIGNLQVVLLSESEAKMKASGDSQEAWNVIQADMQEHTHFLPKVKDLALLVRSRSIKMLSGRASVFCLQRRETA